MGLTYGLHHGHAVGELALPDRTFSEFFAYDKFICPNNAARDAFVEDSKKADPLGTYCTTGFISLKNRSESERSQSLFEKFCDGRA